MIFIKHFKFTYVIQFYIYASDIFVSLNIPIIAYITIVVLFDQVFNLEYKAEDSLKFGPVGFRLRKRCVLLVSESFWYEPKSRYAYISMNVR